VAATASYVIAAFVLFDDVFTLAALSKFRSLLPKLVVVLQEFDLEIAAFAFVFLVKAQMTVNCVTLVAYRGIVDDFNDSFTVGLLAGLFRGVFLGEIELFMLLELLFELNRQSVKQFAILIYRFSTSLFWAKHIFKRINLISHKRSRTWCTKQMWAIRYRHLVIRKNNELTYLTFFPP
jgi:hypothetical protein